MKLRAILTNVFVMLVAVAASGALHLAFRFGAECG
jgi:hypothetical protein